MPIYEYECERCGAVEEVFQKFSDKPLSRCPKCSGKMHKLISQSTFHLKGSGWYVTDYARSSRGSTSQKSDSAGSDSGDSSKKKESGATGSAT
ncbi:MAG: FmdB family zinc ribbon protein [Desulfobacterales bacterium]